MTAAPALAVVRRVFHAENLKLVEALQAVGARASSIVGGVFEAGYLDKRKFKLVGKVTRVHQAPIDAAIKAGSIPVIASLGETPGGQILNVNADIAANELVTTLKPYKIIFLTGTGGLLDGEGKVIDSINLSDRVRAPDAAAVAALGHAPEDRADPRPAAQAAAGLLGVDDAPGRTGQGAVHAPRLRHPDPARRAHPPGRRPGSSSISSACAT